MERISPPDARTPNALSPNLLPSDRSPTPTVRRQASVQSQLDKENRNQKCDDAFEIEKEKHRESFNRNARRGGRRMQEDRIQNSVFYSVFQLASGSNGN